MRTPKPTRSGAARDLTLLVRALDRAERDESRPPGRREALCAHLRGAIHIMTDEGAASTSRRVTDGAVVRTARQKRSLEPPAEV